MDTERAIRELKYTANKHRKDTNNTFQTNITAMCEDIFPKMELLLEYENTNLTPAQLQEIDKLYAEKCKEVAQLKDRLEVKDNNFELYSDLLDENEQLKTELERYKPHKQTIDETCCKMRGCNKCDAYRKECERLKAELKHSIKLPCKVGDTVYYLKFVNRCDRCEYNHPGKCKFDGKNVKCKENISEIVEKEFCLSMWSIYTEKLIHGFYTTREEAEKALTERKSGNEQNSNNF